MRCTEFESGIKAEKRLLVEECRKAIDVIKEVVWFGPSSSSSSSNDGDKPYHATTLLSSIPPDPPSPGLGVVPQSFFDRNEQPWRGRVRHEAMGGRVEPQSSNQTVHVA